MRSYQLYLIEEEFARHFYGRERTFYQLFKDYKSARGDMRKIISKQVNFVTKPIPVLRIHQLLHQQLSRMSGFRAEQGIYYLEKNNPKSLASIKVNERSLTIESSGDLEAETIFFEVLRKNETSFLAVDISSSRYGWLKPIKERKFV
ncbi:sporulation inhibitor of replication protein SirA [Bacillus sp. FJAT-27251]|uniref:sporulation inhibitor of replication protein SirA n=1 Tax=Bacillus sp. FJAT-27251 TaxID=1684142 RepID=UPI0006A7DD2E|nr:sporulation inhibitor of replication protein SirA [Bacillus sp. FJAT-27251]